MGETWSQPDSSLESDPDRLEGNTQNTTGNQSPSSIENGHEHSGSQQDHEENIDDLEEALRGSFLDTEYVSEDDGAESDTSDADVFQNVRQPAVEEGDIQTRDGSVPPHAPTAPNHHEYTHNTSDADPLPLEASTSLTNSDPQPPSPPKLPLSPSAIALNDIPDDDLDLLTRHHAARLAQLFYKESNAVVVADYITRVSHSHRDINPIVAHLLRTAQHLPTATVTPARLPNDHGIDSSAAVGAAGAEEVCRYGWDDISLLLPHECRVTFFDAAADVMSRDGELEEADIGAGMGEGGVGEAQSIGGEDVSRLLPVLDSEDSLYSSSVYRDVPLPSVLIRARTGLYLSGLCAVEKVLLDVLIYLVWVYRATGLDAFMELYDEVLACPRDAMENGAGKDNPEIPAGNSQMLEFGFPHQENTFDNLQLLVYIYFTSL